MKLIIGLGNPGKSYEKSKHNIGFLCLDAFAKTKQAKFSKEVKFQGEICKLGDLILLKPKTFMNLSGLSVRAVSQFFQIDARDILVISDDMDLTLFQIRLRENGGSGGHNGLKSILEHVGSPLFKRLRIGIDRKDSIDAKDYVLSKFSKAETKEMESLFAVTNQILDLFSQGIPFDQIMNQFNKKEKKTE
jgi:PTH1 family peptidyl-tRNA hydrolase